MGMSSMIFDNVDIRYLVCSIDMLKALEFLLPNLKCVICMDKFDVSKDKNLK